MLNVCAYPLSQPSSRDVFMLNVFVYPFSQPSSRDELYVKCLCAPLVSAQQ